MEVNLSPEMIKVVRNLLRTVPLKTLEATVAGWEDEYAVSGNDALDLFEVLYQDHCQEAK